MSEYDACSFSFNLNVRSVPSQTSLGFSNPGMSAQVIGLLEIIAAFAVLIRPVRSVLLVLLMWKIISELFYPHYELFEWIERGGSYGAILALWLVLSAFPSKAGDNKIEYLYLQKNNS